MNEIKRAFRKGIYWTLGIFAFAGLIVVLVGMGLENSCRANERIVDAMVTCMKAPTLTCTYTPAQLIEAERARLDFIEACRDNNG